MENVCCCYVYTQCLGSAILFFEYQCLTTLRILVHKAFMNVVCSAGMVQGMFWIKLLGFLACFFAFGKLNIHQWLI